MGTGDIMLGGGVTLGWTSIPSRGGGGSSNTSNRFRLLKQDYAAAVVSH